MDGDHFNAEYYQYLLSSLTLNSRALITELTAAADKFSDHAEEIVALVEERIKKSLPQHKLFAVYLLDLICKNIGNPYNLLFGYKLHRIFTECYLVVTDTPTRQSLIDLFKTWARAKTSAGVDLFPRDVLDKIESFIIKATTIAQEEQRQVGPKQQLSAAASTHYLTPDMLLREANCLLQYIIALNTELDKYPMNETMEQFQRAQDAIRNPIILQINAISETIMASRRLNFETHVNAFHNQLLGFRKTLDDQVVEQRRFIETHYATRASQTAYRAPTEERIKLDYEPTVRFFSNWTVEIVNDKELLPLVHNWGLQTAENNTAPTPPKLPQEPQDIEVELPQIEPADPTKDTAANTLGMNFSLLNFMDSMLSSAPLEPYISLEDDNADSYDPQDATDEALKTAIPPFDGTMPRPSLKRSTTGEPRPTKRVRFAM